jgi:head-tail adaptor
MPAGNLHRRVAFDIRSEATDEYGNVLGDWSEEFAVSARIQYLRGGETVMASRLEGRQPVVLTVRRSPVTAEIETSWRARDARSGETFNIRSIVATEDRAWFDILCDKGVVSG